MSLVALAIRIAAVQALKGATLAGAEVYDSPLDPFDLALAAREKPTIAVYTGEDRGTVEGRDWLAPDQMIDLSFQVMLPTAVPVPSGDGTVTLRTRDAGAEMVFDLVWRQISAVLMAGTSDWAELWRLFVGNTPSISARPFIIEGEDGVRIAAQEIVIMASPTIGDPPFGAVLDGTPWQAFLLKLADEPALLGVAEILTTAIETPNDLDDWQAARAVLGLTLDVADGIGIFPIVATEEALSEITLGDGFEINADVAEDNPDD